MIGPRRSWEKLMDVSSLLRVKDGAEGTYSFVWTYQGIRSNPLGIFVMPDYTATIETNHGTIKIEFYPEDAPKSVENFVKLAKKGFYDGKVFHRIIKGFMMQGGCPKGDGSARFL